MRITNKKNLELLMIVKTDLFKKTKRDSTNETC